MFNTLRVYINSALMMIVVMTASFAQAKAKLETLSAGVIVYSGPATFYRPLAVLPAKTELRAGSKPQNGRDGQYYRVLVKINDKVSSIGFISANADIRVVDDRVGEDDLEKFGDVALIQKAIQATYTLFPDQQSMYTAGYIHYLSPGFFVKGFAGQFSAPEASALVGGAEIGNDALLFRRISGLVSYGAGVFAPSEKGKIFDASGALNAMMQATFGLRYNFAGLVSVSAAGSQAVFFNANNSRVVFGAHFTVEVGL